MRPSNFHRHWGRRHGDQPVPDMGFRRMSTVRPGDYVDRSGFPTRLTNLNVVPVKYENEDEVEGDLEALEQNENSLTCGFTDCQFVSATKSEMAAHRRKLGHPSMRKSVDNEDDLFIELGDGTPVTAPAPIVDGQGSKGAKYGCDSPGCGYNSNFRGNLVRHCRKYDHFSEIILQTMKVPDQHMMQLANEAKNTVISLRNYHTTAKMT